MKTLFLATSLFFAAGTTLAAPTDDPLQPDEQISVGAQAMIDAATAGLSLSQPVASAEAAEIATDCGCTCKYGGRDYNVGAVIWVEDEKLLCELRDGNCLWVPTRAPMEGSLDLLVDSVTTLAPDPGTVAAFMAIIQNAPQIVDLAREWEGYARGLIRTIRHLRNGNLWPLWGAQYADGTIVYNKFRAYRSLSDVAAHFTDQTRGDRDAWMYVNGRKVHVRYGRGTGGAAAMVRAHGKIVNFIPYE